MAAPGAPSLFRRGCNARARKTGKVFQELRQAPILRLTPADFFPAAAGTATFLIGTLPFPPGSVTTRRRPVPRSLKLTDFVAVGPAAVRRFGRRKRGRGAVPSNSIRPEMPAMVKPARASAPRRRVRSDWRTRAVLTASSFSRALARNRRHVFAHGGNAFARVFNATANGYRHARQSGQITRSNAAFARLCGALKQPDGPRARSLAGNPRRDHGAVRSRHCRGPSIATP